MNRAVRLFLPLFAAVLSAGLLPVRAGEISDRSPRFLVHLLDYLAADYAGAVKDGKVLSASEYKEQVEFSGMALELSRTLPQLKKSPEVQAMVSRLQGLIAQKAGPAQVSLLARQTEQKVIAQSGLSVAPSLWPNLRNGRALFQKSCALCHGMEGRGNGPSAKTLSTRPADFMDDKAMSQMSPFKAFNTVRLGVPGTAMASFPSFSDKEAWDLAFYVVSLRYQSGVTLSTADFEKLQKSLGFSGPELLQRVASLNDRDLSASLPGSALEKKGTLGALRLHTLEQSEQALLDFARSTLEQSLADYRAGRESQAHDGALKAYVEGVEPAEPKLRASDLKATSNLEEAMGLVRNDMASGKPLDQVAASGQKALACLQKAMELLGRQVSSPWLTFVLAFGIFLREGFEASLLIVALLGVLKATGAVRAAVSVHAGWLSALALGVAAWFLSGWLMILSGAGRELLEAVTGALTILVLLYLGFWLHSRTEIHRWKTFIEGRIQAALKGSNLLELFAIAFMAAFREAFETVLFLRAIWLGGGADSKAALLAGVLSALALILWMSWLLLRFSTRLPLKSLFTLSSIIMVVLAVMLAGQSVHSFQEVDYLAIHPFPLNLHFDWFGLYPTWETLAGQGAVLALSLFLWIYGKKPPQPRQPR